MRIEHPPPVSIDNLSPENARIPGRNDVADFLASAQSEDLVAEPLVILVTCRKSMQSVFFSDRNRCALPVADDAPHRSSNGCKIQASIQQPPPRVAGDENPLGRAAASLRFVHGAGNLAGRRGVPIWATISDASPKNEPYRARLA